MSKDLIMDALEAMDNKPFIILGKKEDSYVVVDISTLMVRVISKESLRAIAQSVSNLEVTPKGVEITTISTSRLELLLSGKVAKFGYVLNRYKDSLDDTMGYLVLYITTGQNPTLHRVSVVDTKKIFTAGTMLNAKLVERDGKEVIAGIMKPIPEKVMNTKTEKSGGSGKKADALSKKQKEHQNYLAKFEKDLKRNFLTTGYASKITLTRDNSLRIKRFMTEVVANKRPDLFNIYKQNATFEQACKILDVYIADNYFQGVYKDLKRVNSFMAIYKYIYNLKSINKKGVLVIYSEETTLSAKDLDFSEVDTSSNIMVTLGAKGLLAITPTSIVKDMMALQEGIISKEILLFQHKGQLADYNLPMSASTRELFEKRDKAVLYKKNNKVHYNLQQEVDKLTSRQGFKVQLGHLPVGLKIVNERKVEGSYDRTVTVDEMKSPEMFNAFGYEALNGEKTPQPIFGIRKVKGLDEIDSELNFEEIRPYVTDVGDVILVDNILNGEYGISTFVAMLAIKNRTLLKALINSVGTNFNIIGDIDSVPSSSGIVYSAGGKLGSNTEVLVSAKGLVSFSRSSRLSEKDAVIIDEALQKLYNRPSKGKALRLGVYKNL